MLATHDWYSRVTLLGHAINVLPDPDLVGIDRLSRHDTGHENAGRTVERRSCWLENDRWTGWGKLKS